MLYSMTGFARQSAEFPFGTLTWELRAVNHRYLDVGFRLPEELRPKEHALRQQVSNALSRGKIECSLNFRRALDQQSELRLNRDLAKLIGKRAAELAALLPDVRPVDPIDVLRWPGVVEEPEFDTEPVYAEASTLLGVALDAVKAMRASEGERIGELLLTRCDDIARISGLVRRRMPEVLAAAHARQKERIENLDVQADPARLEVELALIAQKLDVDEELDRLDSHLAEIRTVLSASEPVGRRLDFLMQELNREANTLASKSADTESTKAAVELKVIVEQMREQIQNIE